MKVVKWFLICLLGAVCSTTLVWGDAANDLEVAGTNALADEKYDVAAQNFTQIIQGYPNTPDIDDIHIKLGFAYLHMGKFQEAIDTLAKNAASTLKPAYRGTALYFTGLAQFSEGQDFAKKGNKALRDKAFSDAVTTFSTLVDFIKANPSPDNQGFMEDSYYYRALAEYQKESYGPAEKDLVQLINDYSTSLKRPDYLLLLGSLYAVETNLAVTYNNDDKNTVKKTPEEIKALAQKALDTFDKVTADPNALVQANDANMSKAEVLYLIAQLSAPDTSGYTTALDAYRQVRRKDDMIDIQKERLDQLKKASGDALRNNPGGASFANENVRLIDRETGRLSDLTNGPDPIIQALIRMAECYISLKQPDEARTILRRLQSHVKYADTQDPDEKAAQQAQQKEIDFQLLYSYAQGGQADKADKGLTDYLAKYPNDPQADAISYLDASAYQKDKNYNAAVNAADRSIREYPNGRYIAESYSVKAQALRSLGKLDEATKVLDAASKLKASGAVGWANKLTQAQTLAAQGDLTQALDIYKDVKDSPDAADMQSYGAAGYIQTLQALNRFPDVVTESKAFIAKYPQSKALPGVMVFEGLAMDKLNDGGATVVLQNAAKLYPQDQAAPFALFYVVTINQRAGNLAGMVQAEQALRTAFPTEYVFLMQAADMVGAEYMKQKKYDLAIAEYQPLADAPEAEVAAAALNKIGEVWLASAKGMGAYQSMQKDGRADAEKRLSSGEQAYLSVLQKYGNIPDAVSDAFDGLVAALKQRRSWGLVSDLTMEAYFDKLTAGLTPTDVKARVEMAKAGLVFIYKNGVSQYPAALDRFRKVIAANPSVDLTRQETNQYGELLLAAKDYPTALKVYNDLLSGAKPTDQVTLADAYYGLGATYLAQGDVAQAKVYFLKMTALPNGAAWHPHIVDAQFGIALANENSTNPTDLAQAKQIYGTVMQSIAAPIALQAKATLGYGRMLEKEGHIVTAAEPNSNVTAVYYYEQVNTLFSTAVADLSAEGLYDAGQAYEKAKDPVKAKKAYSDLIKTYGTTEWAPKATDALKRLGA